MLVINAEDDPIVPHATIPASLFELPYLTPVITTHGGHVAFIEGTPLRPHFWFEPLVARFLLAQLGVGAGAT